MLQVGVDEVGAKFSGRDDYERNPAAIECLEKDLDDCITYLRFPREHRKRLRTTNLLGRTFGDSRRRTNVSRRFPGEHACLRRGFAILLTGSRQWRGVPVTPKILRALDEPRVHTLARKEQAAP